MPYKDRSKRLMYAKKYNASHIHDHGVYNTENARLKGIKYRKKHRNKVRVYDNAYKKKHYLRYKTKILARNRKRKYGVNPEDYEKAATRQKGLCAICGIHKSRLKRALNVDHSHITKEFRGLLCSNCNTGLGLFKDNTIFLQNAIVYLQKWGV